MNGLDLFSGIGGISIALRDYIHTVAYCEINPYCQGVLLSRMSDGLLDTSPIWDDISTLQGGQFKGLVDIIFGGFPCQDISVAGNGKGLEGKRSGLFFEIVRLSKEIKPKFIFLENVPAITTRGGLQVVREITEMGYDCRWCHVSAAEVGARHKRERWFLLAYSQSQRLQKRVLSIGDEKEQSLLACHGENDGHTESKSICKTNKSSESFMPKRYTWRESIGFYRPFESREHWQEVVDSICRSSDGVPYQVDRIRSLGNAVVPFQVKKAFEILMGYHGDRSG